MANQDSNRSAVFLIISIFFFWGFVAASNDILIPVFKENLNLKQWQSQMISFAFYVAYTTGSVIYFLISRRMKKDLLNHLGYKNGIALGLVISALGTLLFYPAARLESFPIMLGGLFIVGLGFSLQQTAANPLVIMISDRTKGSQRLSLAGGINNIGTMIGPILISYAIFGAAKTNVQDIGIKSVEGAYLILGAAFIVVAAILKFSSIPNHLEQDYETPKENEKTGRSSALYFPQLVLGMIAIFVYVGVEVSTGGNLSEYIKQTLLLLNGEVVKNTPENLALGGKIFPENELGPYISLFWASLMIGRWTASVDTFGLKGSLKSVLKFLLPYFAFMVFLGVIKIAGHDVVPFYVYGVVIILLIAADFISRGNPSKQLFIYSLLGIAALFTGMFTEGKLSVYSFISVGLFCSTLWPCIFTLAISGLGKHTNEGSSFLIMMIMGGGFISVGQGLLADHITGIRWSFIVGVFCFAYLAFYAVKAASILKKQGVQIQDSETGTPH